MRRTFSDFGTRATHSYMLCGWRTHSEIPLTGVPTSVNDRGNIDIVIQIANEQPPTAQITDRFIFDHSEERSLIKVKNVANFEIRGGRQIRVWPIAGATQKDIEIFLLGKAWGALCYQRGTLPLHASAVVTGNGITAFAGHSGAGKSTTAALLTSLGYELIADDILPISFDRNSTPGAWPYLRRLKLHHDPITQFGLRPTEIVSENIDNKRYFVHPKHASDDKWRTLQRLYLLANDVAGSRAPIELISGADAVRALIDQTYHFKFILQTRRFRDHLAFCAQLASKILIYRLCSPALSGAGEKLASLIRAHLDSTEALR